MATIAHRFCVSVKTTNVVNATMVLVALFFCATVRSEDFKPERISSAVQVDGICDEPVWQTIAPVPLTVYLPENGAPPSEKSEIRLAYDDQFLYVSGRMFDSDHRGIRANTLYRDGWSGDDTLEVILDTFHDHQNAVHFWTTPLGIRAEETIANDAVGDNIYNLHWNTFWDAASRIERDGWSVEVRIPFSSLRFTSENGKVVMGITLIRYIARKNETDVFPPRPAKWSIAQMKPSLTQTVVFTGIKTRTPIYVTPYALGAMQNRAASPDSRSLENTKNQEYGGDAKFSVTSDLTLDLTANTDFAQVEADNQQINLSPFAIFLPEKRLFFQERSNLFDFSTSPVGKLFYSRRIGLTDDGQPVRIYGGARMMGAAGKWDLGMMNMQTARTGETPAENMGVFHFRRHIINPSSYSGFMLTTRINDSGGSNINYGFDNNWKFSDARTFLFNIAQTIDSNRDIAPSVASSMLRVQFERSVLSGWSYRGAFAYSGRDFHPDLGFVEREDFHQIDTRLAYAWQPVNSPVRYHLINTRPLFFFRNSDASLQTADLTTSFDTSLKAGYFFSIGPHFQYESLRESFPLSSAAQVPAGDYSFPGISSSVSTPDGNKVGIEFDAYLGKYYDGTRRTLQFLPRWYLSRHLSLSGEYDISDIEFSARNETFLAQLAMIHADAAFNTRFSLSSFLQFNTVDHQAGLNVRFRFNPSEGTDLYIVYNQNINTDRFGTEPVLPLTRDRSFTVKYARTFDF